MSIKQHLTWSQSKYPISWSNNSYIWSDVSIIIEAATVIASGDDEWKKWQQHNTVKKRRLIKLLVTVDAVKYSDQKYKKDDIMLSVNDVKLLVDTYITAPTISIELNHG